MEAIRRDGDDHSGTTDEQVVDKDPPAAPVSVANPEQVPPRVPSPTRLSAAWTAAVVAVVVLVALVVFIAENTQQSTVNFFGVHGHAPTSVVLLIAAVTGAVIIGVVGVARILQLRARAKHLDRGPVTSHP
jgi:putative membrane protein